MDSAPVEAFRTRLLDDVTGVKHNNAMGDVLHNAEVVRNKKIRNTELLLKVQKEIHDLSLDRYVERADRLVAYNKVRLNGETSRNSKALALAARKFVRVSVQDFWAHSDALQEFNDAPFLFASASRQLRLSEDVAHRHSRIQTRVRILKNDLHPPSERLQFAGRQRCDFVAIEGDPPKRRFDQSKDESAQRALAGAALADESDRFTGADS
ncbi:hypothetical protein OUZ56_032433 [Daphnia magna]|uniref:Uncharacterized protein n=1 Tax=Daphnia magna TaxID=35525 RepID=A0ABR0B8W4_9CRUS|nr:hypothetical protein OUZ56_032433 [Daphnia magna]